VLSVIAHHVSAAIPESHRFNIALSVKSKNSSATVAAFFKQEISES
jgi:hypothetical protein